MKRTRPGFSLIEVLIVFAILAFAIGLLLPLVQFMRNNALRTQSQNNLKMIGIAAHTHHDARKHFPAGVDDKGFSAVAHMLPYLEQENIYKLINFNMPARAQPEQVRMAALPMLISPLDPLALQQAKMAPTSYLFCAGTKHSLEKNNGVFFKDSKLTLPVITSQDGSSNTVMAGETTIGDGGQQAKDVKRQHVKLDVMGLQNLNDNSGVQEFQNNRNIAGDRGHSWIEGKFLHGTFTGTRKLNDARPDVDCGGAGGLSALRTLQKGTNILFADGHAIFLNDTVDFNTWQALCTRDGGEVIGNLP